MKQKYIICQGETFGELKGEVERRLKEGYYCVGGVAFHGRIAAQAMLLKKWYQIWK